ncbi:hypothetical protein DFH06DRAFT_1473420, partial [Mycena polygramma]
MVSSAELVPSSPKFPEDLERTITEVLLNDAADMCGTMSLLASRFHAWAIPFAFHTVVIHQRDDWMQRISECFLPNANTIHVLVLHLPSREHR